MSRSRRKRRAGRRGWPSWWPLRRSPKRRRRRRGHSSWWSKARTEWIIRTGSLPLLPWRRAAAAVGVASILVGAAYGSSRMGLLPLSSARPGPVVRTLPVLPVIPVSYRGVSLETYLDAWVPHEQRDELLASPVMRDPEFARRVHWWIGYWTGAAEQWFPGFLERMAWLGSTVDSALVARGFPPSLRYLPLIESGYHPGVTSGARAVGLWQLMAPTARELGLEVTPLLDERRHIEKSTQAALRYLEALHREFDSWFLVLAAYNTGPTRVRAILRRHAPDEPRTDSLFWSLRDRFAPETRDFLPKLYGAMWVAARPEAYGYEAPVVEPLAFDLVRVTDQTTLDVIARAAEAPHEEIVRMNAEFVRGITPPGREVTLRVPKGRARTFAFNYAHIPPEERVSFVEHVVRTGETLSTIAVRYGVRTGDIEAANPSVRARTLSVGARLTVPVAPSMRPE